jgi:hypothetical protein
LYLRLCAEENDPSVAWRFAHADEFAEIFEPVPVIDCIIE